MVSSGRSEKRRCPHFFFVRCMLELTKSARGRHIHTKVPRPFDFNNEVSYDCSLRLTLAQIAKLCEQALQLSERYNQESMKDIRGRRAFVGSLTSADEITATRGFLTKQQKKDARKRDTGELSAAERSAIEAESARTPLGVQSEETALLAITPSQRVFSVLVEEKITGQVNGEATFWSKIKGAE